MTFYKLVHKFSKKCGLSKSMIAATKCIAQLLDDVLDDPFCGVIYVSTLHDISKGSVEILSGLFNKSFSNQTKLYSVENHFKIGGLGDLVSMSVGLRHFE